MSCILENKYVRLEISKKDASVKNIFDKKKGCLAVGEETKFFSLIGIDKKTEYYPTELDFDLNVFTVKTVIGEFKVKVTTFDEYFVFELLTDLPEGAYKANIAHAKYSYEYSKENTGAAGIAMTWWVNPCFFPDAKDKETNCQVIYKKVKGAKYALIIAPVPNHADIIKKVCMSIDVNEGIVNPKGGVWSRECSENYGNIITDFDSTSAYLDSHIPYYKNLGVDIIDFHKNYFGSDPTFRQGDFKPLAYENNAEFKKNVSDKLEKNGMSASLHTYAFLIDYDCDTILSDPKYQKQLNIVNSYTLSKPLTKDASVFEIEEPLDTITSEHGFIMQTSQYLLVDNEIIKFEKDENGLKILERGACKTVADSHKKGVKINQINGMFGCLSPAMDSDLFLEIAQLTAKAYNEGGYKNIYLDALDAAIYTCNREEDEIAFYMSAFVCEVLKHCKTPPSLDYSIRRPCLWAGRSRVGSFDTPYRAYKNWNKYHVEYAKSFMDMYYSTTLGWYNFYGVTESDPGNVETKYQYTDAVHHLGSLSVMYNCSMTYVEFTPENYDNCPALRRNVDIYRRYDILRKKKHFSETVLEKLRNGKYEYHLNDEDVFVEKDYKIAKLYDLSDNDRNTATFDNPFDKQTPFIRIEALLFCDDSKEGIVILPSDKNVSVSEQEISKDYGECFDISGKFAKKVSVTGNGKKGAIAIKLRSKAKGYFAFTEYIIDTDFEGEREFILCEIDKGERTDLGFDKNEWNYGVYRFSFDHSKFIKAEVVTEGDVSGVKMGDVVAYPHKYETIKNPSVSVGESTVTFNCELKSTDYLEFDGKTAKMMDRYGNETKVSYTGEFVVPSGEFEARLTCLSDEKMPRAQITFGFTGEEIK
ncbi:MAG: hypothetical protein J6A69_01945 [Clostridia bacterium]|nr:hypothetical protein [Clostridia bacterium]